MKLLFLRGQVIQDRDPKQIMFDSLESCDDCWTQLAYALCKDDYGEIWYWNGKRKVAYKFNFIDRWVPSFKIAMPSFQPDIIFARGGFSEYDDILRKFPKAFKIYYGAGKRFYPTTNFKDYDLILNDTPEQVKKTREIFPFTRVELFIKPAAENIFYPHQYEKIYDVIMIGNKTKSNLKGHDFVLPNWPKNLSLLQVGIIQKDIINKYKNIDFTGWVPRKKIPHLYAKAKVAIVCCTTKDSCPRVIPEALACNCPILVLDRVNFWKEKLNK